MCGNFNKLGAVAFAVFALSTAQPSEAQKKPKILVLPYQAIGEGTSNDILDQTTNLVGAELESSGVPVLEGSDSIQKLGGSNSGASGSKKDEGPKFNAEANDKALEMLSKGRTFLEDQEIEDTIRVLKKAIRYMDGNGESISDLAMLSEAHILLATAYFQDGEEDEADDNLSKAIHYAPQRKLSPRKYPPIFIRSYERAKFNVLRRPRARLEIKSGKNAQIFLDGRPMGKSPLLLKDVLPGNHWVRAQSPGEDPIVKRLLVRSRKTIAVNLGEADGAEAASAPAETSGLVGAVSINEVTRSHVAQVQAVGRKRRVDFVLVGGINKSRTAYNVHSVLVNVKTGDVGRLTSVAFDLDLLTAQIEVYKLADDIREQCQGEDPLNKKITAAKFRLDPKLDLTSKRSRRAVMAGTQAARMRTVAAAPRPMKAPAASNSIPPPPPTQVARNDSSSSGGRRPLASPKSEEDIYGSNPSSIVPKDETKTIAAPQKERVVPKDETDDLPKVRTKIATEDNEDKPFLPRKDSSIFKRQAPEEEERGDSMWWIWVAVGVAVAGAGGTGLYLGLSDSSSSEGELTIRW